MPFPEQPPRAFNRASIETLNAGQKGCYGLFRAGHWVYIGKADDIRKRLLEHLAGCDPCVVKEAPTHCLAAVTADNDTLEQKLIREYRPICNIHHT